MQKAGSIEACQPFFILSESPKTKLKRYKKLNNFMLPQFILF